MERKAFVMTNVGYGVSEKLLGASAVVFLLEYDAWAVQQHAVTGRCA